MDEPKKYKCRCGKDNEILRTYFKKGDTVRVTMCNSCADSLGFNDNDKDGNPIYNSSLYEKLTKEQQVKLPPTYAN